MSEVDTINMGSVILPKTPSEEPVPLITPPRTPQPVKRSYKICIFLAVCLTIVVVTAVVVVSSMLLLIYESDSELGKQIRMCMNMSADPCVDFYNYACGGWHQFESVQNATEEISFITTAKYLADKQLLGILQRENLIGDPKYMTQPRDFFQACSNLDKRGERGIKPFVEFVISIGAFPLMFPTIHVENFQSELEAIMVKLTLLGVMPLFTTRVEYGTNGTSFFIDPPDFSFMDQNPVVYKNWTISVLKLLGINNSDSKINAAFELQNKVKKIMQATADANASKTMNISELHLQHNLIMQATADANASKTMNISELHLQHTLFNWTSFFKAIGKQLLKTELSGDEVVHVNSSTYLAFLELALTNESHNTVLDFMMKSLLHFTTALGTDFIDLWTSANLDANFKPPSQESCSKETTLIFPELVARMYADTFFPRVSLPSIKELISRVRQEFVNAIDDSTWLSLEARSDFKFKMHSMAVNISFPDNALTDDVLNGLYSMIPTHNYFEAIVAATRLRFKEQNNLFNGIKESWAWKDRYFKLSGKYVVRNTLVLPTIFFNNPVFNIQYTSAMKYGALGFLISKQIAKYIFEDGNWLVKKEAAATLQFKQKCFVGQYNSFNFQGLQVRGKTTLFENMFDYEGLKISFNAYHSFTKSKGRDLGVPGIDLSQDQLFFISFAQMHCQKIPSNLTQDYLQQAVAPYQVRVNGTLQNSRDFSDAFNCRSGKPMRRENLCKLL